MDTATIERGIFQKTRAAILATNLLNEPLFSIYALLAFILRKDLGATAFQIALLMMLKPLVSIFSLYWCAGGVKKKRSLRSNVVWAGFLARVPFLFFPFFDNVWFFIAAAALHMLFLRASTPAWMEILKLNMGKKERERSFSQGSALGYAEGVLIALGFGSLLDHHLESWKLLFFLSALLGIVGVWLQQKVPVSGEDEAEADEGERQGWKETVLWPWKTSLELMRTRKDFAIFQWGFMACGFGIMMIQPALPLFFVDVLHLSYTDLAIAFSICKGLGFVSTSQMWAKAMGRFSISTCSSVVFIGVGLFPLTLLLAPFSLFWLYLAYIIYGIAQAGSHLIWHLSGPLFAKQEDSLQYTGVNIVMVGMRGMIAPPLGGAFCVLTGPIFVLVAGVGLCFLGSWTLMSKYSKRFKKLVQN